VEQVTGTRTYVIHFDRIGAWIRDETASFEAESPGQLVIKVAAYAGRRLITRDVTVAIDVEAGTVFLGPGGRHGSGVIVSTA
jgi:hypothetical protein